MHVSMLYMDYLQRARYSFACVCIKLSFCFFVFLYMGHKKGGRENYYYFFTTRAHTHAYTQRARAIGKTNEHHHMHSRHFSRHRQYGTHQ